MKRTPIALLSCVWAASLSCLLATAAVEQTPEILEPNAKGDGAERVAALLGRIPRGLQERPFEMNELDALYREMTRGLVARGVKRCEQAALEDRRQFDLDVGESLDGSICQRLARIAATTEPVE